MTDPNANRPSAAFTLVELLTVIAIVAILAALLFPALAKYRESIGTGLCAAHLRTWGQAMSAYAADNDSRLYFGFNEGPPPSHWVFAYLPYMGSEDYEKMNRDPGLPGNEKKYWVQYGINAQLMQAANASNNYTVSTVNIKPKGYILTDTVIGTGQGSLYGYLEDRRHHGKSNFLFLDGHVETLAPEIGQWGIPVRCVLSDY